MRTTYKKEDVELLLKDITGLVKPQSTQEREQLIQQGRHYCEMLPIEYSPSEAYMEAYETAFFFHNLVREYSHSLRRGVCKHLQGSLVGLHIRLRR